MSEAVLGIETSCDETAAAVVLGGRKIVSSVVASQITSHAEFGGVVPELASRLHLERIDDVVNKALTDAALTADDLGAIAVTHGPGLVGALLVGLSYAKALAFRLKKPLIPVQHLAGHIAAAYLTEPELAPPFLGLVVSGGHTHLVLVADYLDFRVMGRTRDDAAGETFDKVARALGLGYPGGVKLEELARGGDPGRLKLPQTDFPDSLDFSFSGLKTAALNGLQRGRQQRARGQEEAASDADLAAALQSAIVSTLVRRTRKALEETGLSTLVLAGGVAANGELRTALAGLAREKQVRLVLPPLSLCGDNAAMIAAAGYFGLQSGQRAGLDLNATAVLEMGPEYRAK